MKFYRHMKILFFTFLLTGASLFSQEPINNTDEKGLKQGYWRKTDENGGLVYRGHFKDGHPIDSFFRYYEDGINIKSILFFDDSGEVTATFLYKNDSVAAKGKYVNQKKSGTWEMYSYYTQDLVKRVNFKDDKKHGREYVFYEDSTVCEIIEYKKGEKDGVWQEFFTDGVKNTMAHYKNGKLHGKYISYYPNGMKQTEGEYINGEKEGVWHYYQKDGTKKHDVEWENGVPDNYEKVMEYQENKLEEMEKNAGKIEEPSIETIFGN